AGLVRLFAAAGWDIVIVETVGVGQAEIAIAGLADITLVVLAPGMGDDVQAFKAGIMEIADIFVINKSDHQAAARNGQEIRTLLSVGHRADGWIPPVVRTIATEGSGTEDLMAAIEAATGNRDRQDAASGSHVPTPRKQAEPPQITIDHLGVAVNSI